MKKISLLYKNVAVIIGLVSQEHDKISEHLKWACDDLHHYHHQVVETLEDNSCQKKLRLCWWVFSCNTVLLIQKVCDSLFRPAWAPTLCCLLCLSFRVCRNRDTLREPSWRDVLDTFDPYLTSHTRQHPLGFVWFTVYKLRQHTCKMSEV